MVADLDPAATTSQLGSVAASAPIMAAMDHCFGVCGGPFEVAGKAAAATQPRQGSFDHPPARQYLERFDIVAAFDHLQPDPYLIGGPAHLFAAFGRKGGLRVQHRRSRGPSRLT